MRRAGLVPALPYKRIMKERFLHTADHLNPSHKDHLDNHGATYCCLSTGKNLPFRIAAGIRQRNKSAQYLTEPGRLRAHRSRKNALKASQVFNIRVQLVYQRFSQKSDTWDMVVAKGLHPDVVLARRHCGVNVRRIISMPAVTAFSECNNGVKRPLNFWRLNNRIFCSGKIFAVDVAVYHLSTSTQMRSV